MPFPRAKLIQWTVFGLTGLVLVSLVAAMPLVGMPKVKDWLNRPAVEGGSSGERGPSAELVAGVPDTLRLPPDVVQKFGIRAALVKKATRARQLPPLAGSLALDTSRLARVHARFAGEVVQIGTVASPTPEYPTSSQSVLRPIRFGDKVEKGQLLAVVWSKDLGEKKSELVDAVSRQRLDRETLQRLRELEQKGAISERSVREAERNLEADDIAVARAERTLRSWRLTDREIERIRAEADRIRHRKEQPGSDQGPTKPSQKQDEEEKWAQVEVRASFAGTVVEMNVAVGDLVDTATDLFKIADLTRLVVWAHAYEEDLPALHTLSTPIPWTIHLKADPQSKPLPGTIEKIGDIIDPAQHTALVTGYVDNPDGRLRAGQFITAAIDLPPPPDEVEVPTVALVEDGQESIVFVQADPAQPRYTLRHVTVERRYHDVVYVRSQGLRPGERVVTSGAVELKAALEDLQVTAHQEK